MFKTTPVSSETSMSTRLHNVTYQNKVILKPQNSIFKIQKIKSWCYFEMDNPGFDSRRRQENFLFFKNTQLGSGAQPASLNGYQEAISQDVKRPGREAKHSLPRMAEVKNLHSYTAIPTYTCMPSWRVEGQLQLPKDARYSRPSFANHHSYRQYQQSSSSVLCIICKVLPSLKIEICFAKNTGYFVRRRIYYLRFVCEHLDRSRWPHGLRHPTAAARLLGLRVRIPPAV